MGILEAYSFIQRSAGEATYTMHRLVQVATRAWLQNQGVAARDRILSKALYTLAELFPAEGEFEDWGTCTLYLPHAEAILLRSRTVEDMERRLARANLLVKTADYLEARGNFQSAEKKILESLDIYDSLGLSDTAEALRAKSSYANVVGDMGDVERAIEILRRVFQQQGNLLGMTHQDTLQTIHLLADNLADSTRTEVDFKEAKQLAKREYDSRHLIQQGEDIKSLVALGTYGWALFQLEQYQEAEVILRRCHSQLRLQFGESHPVAASHASILGCVLRHIDQHDEAEHFHRYAVEKSRSLHGDEHINTIMARSNLSVFLSG